MTNQKIKVLYIAGPPRSGSTIIARLLGEVGGFVNVGEAARFLFDRKQQARNAPCGCGQSITECEFWKDIARTIPPGLADAGAKLVRMRRFPSLMQAQHSDASEYRAIATGISDVYRRVLSGTGCDVIVDSSKNPANGLLVSIAPEIELHVLHVTRNPHQVVASWTKKKGYLVTHRPTDVIAWWWSYNILSEALRSKARTYRRIRYEDFVSNPSSMLERVTADVVSAPLPTPFLNGNVASLHLQHALAGNPDKLTVGQVNIGESRAASAGPRKLLIDLLTFPLQLRYRYLLSGTDQ